MGIFKSIDELVKEISVRDHKDSTPTARKMAGAEQMDTTGMSLEEQVEYIANKAAALGRSSLGQIKI